MTREGRLSPLVYSCLLIFSLLMLTGCVPDFFQSRAIYTIAGVEGDERLEKEIKDFLDERASAIDTKKSKRHSDESYQEKQLSEDIVAKLKSEGYYDGRVDFSEGDEAWSGVFTVTAGERYSIRKVSIKPAKYSRFLRVELMGQSLKAETVLDAQKKLRDAIADQKCYFNLAVDQEVTLNPGDKKADIIFSVITGPQAKMGPVAFEGNARVKSSYLEKLPEWKEGDCFQQEKIESLRKSLFDSGLFSSVQTILPMKPQKDGRVPVKLIVKERAARSIGAGVSYYTDEGPGVTFNWKHRNLFGAAENMGVDVKLSQMLQTIGAQLTKPFFLRRNQSLSFNASLDHEETDGYYKKGVDSGVAVKRVFSKWFSGSTGISLSVSNVKDHSTLETSNFYLLSLPQSLTYDSRDNVLDATKGFLVDVNAEPFFDAAGNTGSFLKMQAKGQAYRVLNRRITAALRAKAGSIIGPSTAEIPATQRFYAGGGGSIRGFAYEEVGPVKNGQPAGGRSLIEGSAELRFKFNDSLGLVTFVDAGNVGNTSAPDFSRPSIGAGAGVRYYTDFAPFRFDVAMPLNNKKKTSRSYQFYISIGQAF